MPRCSRKSAKRAVKFCNPNKKRRETIPPLSKTPFDYLYSNVRAYLNGIQNQFVTDGGSSTEEGTVNWDGIGFLQSAFTSTARGLIAETTVDNSQASTTEYEPYHGTALTEFVCNPTLDKIFLLSVKELTTPDYGFQKYDVQDPARILRTTDYAKANNAGQHIDENHDDDLGGYILTRSPASTQSGGEVREINYNGNYYGNTASATSRYVGIVPALCLE